MRRALVLGLLALLALPLVPPAKAQADWTFLVYMAADNDLEAIGVDDFEEMASVGSTAAVNVVVQFDRSDLDGPADGGTRAYGDWEDTRRFVVTPGLTPEPANSLASMGEINMGDPASLVSFVIWAATAFPADRLFLDLWDHGLGWQGIMVDRTSNDYLTTAELRLALDEATTILGRRIDIVGNDACRMTLEVMYEMRAYVDLFIGSEKDTPLEGWPYDRFLQRLTAEPRLSSVEIASALADEYYASYVGTSAYSVTLSAVTAAGLPAVAAATSALADELISYFPYFSTEIQNARGRTERYEQGGVCCGSDYDLYHFTENVEAEVGGPRLTHLTANLRAAIRSAVAYERHWDNPTAVNGVPAKDAHGLSIYFPATFPGFTYQNLLLSENTSWDELLSAFSGGPRIERGLSASTASVDTDADGLRERLEVTATPAVNGTLSVALLGPDGFLSRDVPGVSGVSTTVSFPGLTPGAHRVGAYLFENGKLRNLIQPAAAPVEAFRRFLISVTLNGTGVSGVATLSNPRTGGSMVQAISNGDASFLTVYPTWVADGDSLQLSLEVDGRTLSYTLVPDLRLENHTLLIAVPPATGFARGFDPVSFILGLGIGTALGALIVLVTPFLLRSWRLRKLR